MNDLHLFTIWRCAGRYDIYVARPCQPTDYEDQTSQQQVVARVSALTVEQALITAACPSPQDSLTPLH